MWAYAMVDMYVFLPRHLSALSYIFSVYVYVYVHSHSDVSTCLTPLYHYHLYCYFMLGSSLHLQYPILFISKSSYKNIEGLFLCCILLAGEYLALTGEKLNGVEMIACGLATHYSLSAVCLLCPFPILGVCFHLFFWRLCLLSSVVIMSHYRGLLGLMNS